MDLVTFLESLLRRWWLIVLCAAAGAAIAYVLAINTPRRYQSTVSLQLNPAARSSFLPYQSDTSTSGTNPVMAQAASYQEVLRSRAFGEVVVRDLTLPIPPEAIAGAITTQLIPNTNILHLSATWDNPDDAQKLTQRIAETFIAENQRRQESQPGTQAQLADLEQSARDLQSRRPALQQQRDRLDEAVSRGDLTRLNDLTALDTRLSTLDTSYANLLVETSRIRSSFDTAVILDSAGPARQLDAIPFTQALFFGVVAGLLFAGTCVFLLERAANLVRSPVEVTTVTGVPILATVGHLRGMRGSTGGHSRALVALDRRTRSAEAFRSLRATLMVSALGEPPRTLVLASAGAREGTTLVAANLAIVLAQAGKRVLLIDGNMRSPSLHRLFGVSPSAGFYDALAATRKEGATMELPRPAATTADNLWLLPAGNVPSDPGEALAPDAVRRTVEILGVGWDYLIMDTAPVSRYADTLSLASAATACIVVARSGRTTRPALHSTVTRLDSVAQQIIGVVLNDERPGPLARFGRYQQQPSWPVHAFSDMQLAAEPAMLGLPHNGRASAPTATHESWRSE